MNRIFLQSFGLESV